MSQTNRVFFKIERVTLFYLCAINFVKRLNVYQFVHRTKILKKCVSVSSVHCPKNILNLRIKAEQMHCV